METSRSMTTPCFLCEVRPLFNNHDTTIPPNLINNLNNLYFSITYGLAETYKPDKPKISIVKQNLALFIH